MLHSYTETTAMSCFGEGEEEEGGELRFYDSMDSMAPVAVEEDQPCQVYEIWMNEPFKSVHERRGEFLRRFLMDGFPAQFNDMSVKKMTACAGPELMNSKPLPISHAEADETNFTCTCVVDADEQEIAHVTSAKPDRLSTSSSQSSYEEGSEERAKLRKNWINDKKLVVKLWRSLSGKWRSVGGSESDLDSLGGCSPKSSTMDKVKIHSNNKKVIELSAVYAGQSFSAHCGMIRTMKFSPDGRYLASGGEDGVVRVWLVTSVDGSSKHSTTGCNFGDDLQQGKALRRSKSKYASIVIPEKMMHVEESPLHEFDGHSGDILDLAWSKSNILLSSSMDSTVRMWKIGCAECLNIFQHGSYVTCIQFSPADDNYFISGSTDGKVRTWKVSRGRVVDWIDVRDVVTAICYQTDGKGFVVGSISGKCRFYVSSEKRTQLDAEVHVNGTSNNKITRIDFSAEASRRIMVTLEDSKVHIIDVANAADKYRADLLFLNKMSSSTTSRTNQILSVGEDSHVYVWSYNYTQTPSSTKTALRSCEHFFCDGVSVAIPWLMKPTEEKTLEDQSSLERQNHLDTASWFTDLEPFTGVSRFSMDGARGKISATWPAEQLPVGESPNEDHLNSHHHFHYPPGRLQEHYPPQRLAPKASSASWGLVILTACQDGTIKTYHNYGLPVKL